MDPNDEILIYDALALMTENSEMLMNLVKLYGEGSAAEKAFVNGVYRPCVKLQMVLGDEALRRGRERHAKIDQECKEFFEKQKQQDEFNDKEKVSPM